MIFREERLPNGLTVIGEQNPDVLSFAAGYFVRTGARDEPLEVSGVSHFLEHMLFKGSTRRTAEDVNREFDELGADYNAFTSEEYTVYYGCVLPEFQAPLLDLLTDLMRPVLRTSDFEMEKQVILEEIALYKDKPQFTVIDEARSLYFAGHPLGQSVLGSNESITALQRDQMHAYWEERYSPGNLVLTLTGTFDWNAALAQVASDTAAWPTRSAPRAFPDFAPAPRVRLMRDEKVHRAHLAFVAPGVAAGSEERFAAGILGDILGGGEGSRLYWSLVEPGLADGASLGHDEEDGSGNFFGYASCDPERAQEVTDRVRAVFEKAQSEGVRDDEIERAKRKLASALVIHDEIPRGRLFHVGFEWQYRGAYLPLDSAIDRYLAVTPGDVAALLARRPFDQMSILGLGPMSTLA